MTTVCVHCTRLDGRQSRSDFVTDLPDFAVFTEGGKGAVRLIHKDQDVPLRAVWADEERTASALLASFPDKKLSFIEVCETFPFGHQTYLLQPHRATVDGDNSVADAAFAQNVANLPASLCAEFRRIPVPRYLPGLTAKQPASVRQLPFKA